MPVSIAQPLKRGSDDSNTPEKDDNTKTPKTTPREETPGSGASKVDNELLHVYEEAEIHTRPQRHLKELGILNITDVLTRLDDFKNRRLAGVRDEVQTKLYYFGLWHKQFYAENRADVYWREHFEGETFGDFVDDQLEMAQQSESKLKTLFEHAVFMLHEGTQGELSGLQEEQYELLYEYVTRLVVDKLPEDLKKECQFDIHDLIMKCTRAIFNFPSQQPYPKIQMIAGRTQSGKTAVKVVVQATCDLLKCPLLILTKGVSESKDLSKKINHKLNLDKTDFDIWYNDAQRENRSTVIPDTAARINKKGIPMIEQLRELKPHGKFAVIVDECDAMYRTDARHQQMERAYDDLMGMMPALRIEISATPIPALLVLTEQGHEVEMLELGSSNDYAGVTDMVPLKDPATGKAVFLSVEAIKYDIGVDYKKINKKLLTENDGALIFPDEDLKNGFTEYESRDFTLVDTLDFIPYTNESVMSLYDDALSEVDEGEVPKQGVLLLDCTASRVQAGNNVFQKAACVQNHYFRQNKEVIIVVYVGRGIYVRRPGFQRGRFVPNRKTIGETLNQLDQEFGLEMPIFVFGYSKMRRCISYRSDSRVPTHLCLSLGIGQSNESFIQALGRGTFNGLESVLAKNGFKHVTVLVSENDLKMARKYTNFVHEVSERLKTGASLQQLLSETKEKFKDESNYLRHTNRKTGQIKRLVDSMPGQDKFDDPESCDDFETFQEEDVIFMICKAVRDLVRDTCSEENAEGGESEDDDAALKEINERGFSSKEIQCKYNDLYYNKEDENHTIKMVELNKKLTVLKNRAKLEKIGTGSSGRWRAKNWKALDSACSKADLL